MLRRALFVFAAIALCSGKEAQNNPTTVEQHPYHVSVESNNKHVCSGALIRENVVVTAASCTNGLSAAKLKVRVGSSNIESGGTLIKVNRLIPHKRYLTNRKDYDIAMIVLNEPVVLSKSVQLIVLAKIHSSPEAGKTAILTGFGITDGVKANLEEAHLTVSVLSECKNQYASLIIYITERMFCAGGTTGRRDCQLDPGSPLVLNNHLVGISAWDQKCGTSKYPTIFTNVAEFTKWMTEELNN